MAGGGGGGNRACVLSVLGRLHVQLLPRPVHMAVVGTVTLWQAPFGALAKPLLLRMALLRRPCCRLPRPLTAAAAA